MRYSPTQLDEIRSRLDIVGWISRSLPLKKTGRNYSACCPFHGEKTPSFNVNPERQAFKCFGCGVGGDIFTFTMKRDSLDFAQAVRACAEAANVALPSPTDNRAAGSEAQEKARREKFFAINALARDFFAVSLKQLSPAHPLLAYLKKRTLSASMIEKFSLGYAPDGWQGLTTILQQRKVPLRDALALGLVREKSGRPYDFFRNRLVFPILSAKGHVIGFGARELGDGSGPKYLNSSDSPVYHKGRELYGLFYSQEMIRTQKRIFIVEGYMDAVRMIDAGFPAVAPLGTSLTVEQLRILKRYDSTLYLVFDGDAAGFRALLRSTELCIDDNLIPRIVLLPKGEDPDSLIATRGAESMNAYVEKAPTALDFLVDWLRANPLSKESQSQTLSLFLKLKDPIEKVRHLEKISAFFNVSIDELKRGFAQPARHASPSHPDTPTPKQASGATGWEDHLLHGLFALEIVPQSLQEIMEDLVQICAREDSPFSPGGHDFFCTVATLCKTTGRPPELCELIARSSDSRAKTRLLALVGDIKSKPIASAQEIEELVKKIALLHLKNKLRGLTLFIEKAERHKNIAELAALLEEKMKLLKHLKLWERREVGGSIQGRL